MFSAILPGMARILHVLDHSLPLHSGYTFRTRAIMKAQQRAGWDVAGLTGLRHSANGGGAGLAAETHEGLSFHRTPGHTALPSPMREWREVAMLAERIRALHREHPFDLIHAHSPVLNGLAAHRAAQQLGLPLVYEIRAFWEDAAVGNGTGTENSPRYRLTRALETHIVRQADAVAVICEGLKHDLIAAMARLRRQQPGTQLLLVGGGPCEPALRAQAAASDAAEHIHFTGRVPHEEVERYYSLIDMLVYPRKAMRLTELVTPLKPLEAMAQRRLVAASDVGGHRELIEHGRTGTLFAADDPDALADAVGGLLTSRDMWEERRDTAQAFVRAERDWARNVHRYDPVYHSLLDRSAIECAA